MKVIFIIESFNEGGGATGALLSYIRNNNEITDYCIVCNQIYRKSNDVRNLLVGDKDVVYNEIKNHQYDLLHFFRAGGASYFKKIIKYLFLNNALLPVITTICQKPSYKGLWLTPFEINHSNALVFIDKAAYNDKMYRFIPSSQKRMIYFGVSNQTIEELGLLLEEPSDKRDSFIYGRGSSLNKCPKDMFSIFDRINTPKSFIIVGNGSEKEIVWIKQESDSRDYPITLIEGKPNKEWIKILNTFDVFLYYLPNDCYSSVDGTLGQAMLLEKPIVYCGPEAPKEKLIDGKNALIANHPNDIPKLCEKLYKDKELRTRLGKEARQFIIANFSKQEAIAKYNELVYEILNENNILSKTKIPVSFYLLFFYKSFFHYCQERSKMVFRRFFN